MKCNFFSDKTPVQLLLLLFLFFQLPVQAQRTNNMSRKIRNINGCFGMPISTKLKEVYIDSLIKHKQFTIADANDGDAKKENTADEEINLPKVEYGEFTNLQWRPAAYFHNQLFPSAIISLANYKGQPDDKMFEAIKKPLGFYIISGKSNVPLRWEIECVNKNLFDRVSGYFTYQQENQLSYLQVDVPWNYKALISNVTPAPVDIFFRLYDVHGNKVEKLVTVTLRSINECVYKYKDLDLNFELSAFVQEEDTAIDGILRDALKYKMIDAFWGYEKDSNYVDKQVAAIGRLLCSQGCVFYDMPVPGIDSNDNKDSIYSLRVHTFQRALWNKVESALDGSIIFASVLKRIGLRPLLAMADGHCLLGYYVNDSSIHYVQTGLLSDKGTYANGKLVMTAITSADKMQAFRKSFELARREGDKEFYEADANNRMSVDISLCRKHVSPLPSL